MSILKIFLFLCLLGEAVYAESLSINYAETLIENLQPGVRYSMSRVARLPLKLANRSDVPLRVNLRVALPDQEKLKTGFAAVPSTTWIILETNRLEIAAGSTSEVDVAISVPDDDKFLGGRYQAHIIAEGERVTTGTSISMALAGRLLLTVSPKREKVEGLDLIDLGFKLSPDRVILNQVPRGELVPILLPDGGCAEVENPSDESTELKIESVDLSDGSVLSCEEGYVYGPDRSWLVIDEPTSTLEAHGRKPLKLKLLIPRQAEYAGRKYLIVAAISTGRQGFVQGRRFLKLLIETAP